MNIGIQDGCHGHGLIFDEQIIILLVDLNIRTCHINEFWLKLFLGNFLCEKDTFAFDYRISPIVFILSDHVVKYEYMPYG